MMTANATSEVREGKLSLNEHRASPFTSAARSVLSHTRWLIDLFRFSEVERLQAGVRLGDEGKTLEEE